MLNEKLTQAISEFLNYSTLSLEDRMYEKNDQMQRVHFINSFTTPSKSFDDLILDYKIKRFSELTRGLYKKALTQDELNEYSELNSELSILDTCSRCYFETIDRVRILKGHSQPDKICKYNNKRLHNIMAVECSHFKLLLK